MSAMMAVGVIAFLIMNIPLIGVMEPIANGDVLYGGKCAGRGVRFVHHPPVGMERSEMDGYIESQVFMIQPVIRSSYSSKATSVGQVPGLRAVRPYSGETPCAEMKDGFTFINSSVKA